MIALYSPFSTLAFFDASELFDFTMKLLSGKRLAWYLRLLLIHFQPLPIRTDRDVFHQAAHPVCFFKRFMCPVDLVITFMVLSLVQVMGGFSNPNITPRHRKGIHYSIVANQRFFSFCVCVASAVCVPSFLNNHAPH